MTAPRAWEMAATAGEVYDLDVWWTPDCGYLHLERNPTTVPFACPDGVKPDPHPGSPEYRAALRAVESKAYRWLLARLGLR